MNESEQIERLQVFHSQVEKASKEVLMLILGDMNIDLDKMEEKDYYLDKLANDYQTMIGENGLEVIDFGTMWKRPDRDGTAIDHAQTN